MQELKEPGVRMHQMDVTDDASMKKGVQEILDVDANRNEMIENQRLGMPLSRATAVHELQSCCNKTM